MRSRSSRRLTLTLCVCLLAAAHVGACSGGGSSGGGGAALPAQPAVRTPYVQNVTTDQAAIVWKTLEPTDGVVSWGPTPALANVEASPRGTRHEVLLTGLQPATDYFYRVEMDGQVVADGIRFRTAPTTATDTLRFIAFGDSGVPTAANAHIAALLARRSVDLIVHTGDVVYPGGEEVFYDQVVFTPYAATLAGTPLFPSMGNHDVKTAGGAPYLANWSLPTNPAGDERYYAFGWGNALFVSINTEDPYTAGSPQHTFIESTLASAASNGYAWIIAYMHRGPYSSSTAHGENPTAIAHLVPLFEAYGVQLVLSGHDHCYERTVPMGGVTYVVTGGGGNSLYGVGASAYTAFSISAHHLVEVTISGSTLRIDALAADGSLLDTALITR